ncbi:sulfated surface glycoprotein 185-like [Penaeus japonicus]|uniref:sulfated surface glycoprotein 185-like n=1 Tax=Penaeus japonicus TaxID=27405 RepID=UPI001C713F40|nr:sulfated surface glycoprotein 185-like [Penaeus japonicus]
MTEREACLQPSASANQRSMLQVQYRETRVENMSNMQSTIDFIFCSVTACSRSFQRNSLRTDNPVFKSDPRPQDLRPQTPRPPDPQTPDPQTPRPPNPQTLDPRPPDPRPPDPRPPDPQTLDLRP